MSVHRVICYLISLFERRGKWGGDPQGAERWALPLEGEGEGRVGINQS